MPNIYTSKLSPKLYKCTSKFQLFNREKFHIHWYYLFLTDYFYVVFIFRELFARSLVGIFTCAIKLLQNFQYSFPFHNLFVYILLSMVDYLFYLINQMQYKHFFVSGVLISYWNQHCTGRKITLFKRIPKSLYPF